MKKNKDLLTLQFISPSTLGPLYVCGILTSAHAKVGIFERCAIGDMNFSPKEMWVIYSCPAMRTKIEVLTLAFRSRKDIRKSKPLVETWTCIGVLVLVNLPAMKALIVRSDYGLQTLIAPKSRGLL